MPDNVITENRTHKRSATPSENQAINKRNTYDHSGRMKDHFIALNGGIEQKISNQNYTFRDQVSEKNLGATLVGVTASYLQSLDYSYNDIGWLTKINQESLSANNNALPLTACSPTIPGVQTAYTYAANPDPNDLFYMELKYDAATFPNITGLPSNVQKSGNIGQIAYRVKGRDKQAYNYNYDFLNRLTSSTHYTMSSANAATANNLYNENLTYDERGNILTLNRTGHYTNGATCTYGVIDALTYAYPTNSNRLTSITDLASISLVPTTANRPKGFNPGLGGIGYTYDVNGNLKTDTYKGITNITYNYLNLPTKIEWGTTKSIEFTYTAAGEKIEKRVKTGVNTDYLQTYAGGIDDRMVLIVNQKSSATKALDNEGNATSWIASSTIYNNKVNGDGKIDVTNTASTNEIIQENHYYAFGERACSSHPIWLVGEVKRSFRPAEQRGAISEVKTLCAIAKVLLRETHEGPWLMNDAAKDNGYQYNGKELNGDHGLAWYNYGARFYDATIGSWSVVDPMSEAAHGWNPYRYGFNNPMRFVDPSGMIEEGKVPGGEEEERTIDLANRTVYIGYGEKKDERSNVMVIPSAYSPNDTQSSTGNANCVCGCPGARPCFAPNGTGQEFFADF